MTSSAPGRKKTASYTRRYHAPSHGRAHERAGFPRGSSDLLVGTVDGVGTGRNRRHADRRSGAWRSGVDGVSSPVKSLPSEVARDCALPYWLALWIRVPDANAG